MHIVIMVMPRYPGTSDAEFTVHLRGTGAKRPRLPLGPNATLLARVVRPRASEVISGDAGKLALSRILAISNNLTGSSKDVTSALTLLEGLPSTSALLQSLPAQSFAPWFIPKSSKRFRGSANIQLISRLPASIRLALEMSLHEDDERRALNGELHELEQRWKEAEEIAAIADNMFLPAAPIERTPSAR